MGKINYSCRTYYLTIRSLIVTEPQSPSLSARTCDSHCAGQKTGCDKEHIQPINANWMSGEQEGVNNKLTNMEYG